MEPIIEINWLSLFGGLAILAVLVGIGTLMILLTVKIVLSQIKRAKILNK